MYRLTLLCAILLSLTGCASTDPLEIKAVVQDQLPPDYKDKILEWAKNDFSWHKINSAEIAEPQAIAGAAVICVRVDADNILGFHSGTAHVAYFFRNKGINNHETKGFFCRGDLIYHPFPELLHRS